MKRKVIFILSVITLILIFTPNVFAYESGREVFVRHIDKDTGKLIEGIASASQEAVQADGTSTLKPNSTAPDADFEYSEYYNINVDETMVVTKTLVMQVNGQKYNYLGYNKCTDPDVYRCLDTMNGYITSYRAGISDLMQEYGNNQNNTIYNVIKSDNNDVTIIDFYYTKQKVDDIKPNLYCNTNVWNSTEGIKSNVTYVPARHSIQPYFETPKYVVKDLEYEKVIEEGKVKYKISKFVVYKLESAYLKSSESKHLGLGGSIEITGELVGDGPAAALSGIYKTSEIMINDKSGKINEIKNIVSDYYNSNDDIKFPGKNDIDNVYGENATAWDYAASFTIKANTLNGLRSAKGDVVYQEYDVLNDYAGGTIEFESKNEHYINVFTPVFLDKPIVTLTSNTSINHTSINSSSVILEDGANFEIKVRATDADITYYNNIDPKDKAEFINYYYFIFDFPIIYNGIAYDPGTIVRLTNQGAYNDEGYTYFYAQVNPSYSLSTELSEHKIIVFASAANMPDENLLYHIADQEVEIQIDESKSPTERKYIDDSGNNKANFLNDIEMSVSNNEGYTRGVKMYGDGYYFAMQSVSVRTVSKLYDFKISDCSDLAFKSAFRDSNNNQLQDVNYYSGTRRLYVYTSGNHEYSTLFDRNNIAISGTSSTTTLPLGPYKHLSPTYVSAPKLGYRISFDVKTSGHYDPNPDSPTGRKIGIKPTYYYVSKDGSQVIKDISLYYKDDSGKYKRFENSGYKIFFKPNDGYRFKTSLNVSNTSFLSTKEEALDISKDEFFLDDRMVAIDDTGYIQTWFGEFKLPNTTVATKSGDSVDKALKNGYIGVKFEITCYDSKLGQNIYYDTVNKAANSTINTTQWDYEGYLGFSNPGRKVTEDSSLRIQLEKGIWSIKTQELYEFVRGTVLLYDIDAHAADDIQ